MNAAPWPAAVGLKSPSHSGTSPATSVLRFAAGAAPAASIYLYVNYLYVLVLSRRFSVGSGELSRRFSVGSGELSRRFSVGQLVEVDRAAKARPALTAAVTVSAL